MGSITAATLKDYIAQGYKRNERVGQFGVELSMEKELHGRWGKRVYEVDASGLIVRELLGERIEPVAGATQTPAQASILVDLVAGYEGVLVIDGLELETVDLNALRDPTRPGQQITLPPTTVYESGNATLTFDPSPESSISSFSQGKHIVQVIYWETVEGRGSARSYSWTFEVF